MHWTFFVSLYQWFVLGIVSLRMHHNYFFYSTVSCGVKLVYYSENEDPEVLTMSFVSRCFVSTLR